MKLRTKVRMFRRPVSTKTHMFKTHHYKHYKQTKDKITCCTKQPFLLLHPSTLSRRQNISTFPQSSCSHRLTLGFPRMRSRAFSRCCKFPLMYTIRSPLSLVMLFSVATRTSAPEVAYSTIKNREMEREWINECVRTRK